MQEQEYESGQEEVLQLKAMQHPCRILCHVAGVQHSAVMHARSSVAQ